MNWLQWNCLSFTLRSGVSEKGGAHSKLRVIAMLTMQLALETPHTRLSTIFKASTTRAVNVYENGPEWDEDQEWGELLNHLGEVGTPQRWCNSLSATKKTNHLLAPTGPGALWVHVSAPKKFHSAHLYKFTATCTTDTTQHTSCIQTQLNPTDTTWGAITL